MFHKKSERKEFNIDLPMQRDINNMQTATPITNDNYQQKVKTARDTNTIDGLQRSPQDSTCNNEFLLLIYYNILKIYHLQVQFILTHFILLSAKLFFFRTYSNLSTNFSYH